jgi:hypothetical protein
MGMRYYIEYYIYDNMVLSLTTISFLTPFIMNKFTSIVMDDLNLAEKSLSE